MKKVRVYKVGEAVVKSNNGSKKVVGFDEFAIIVNGNSTIIIDMDACHYFKDLPETFKIGIANKVEGKIALMADDYIYPTVEWILKNVEYKEVELSEWIMYYNIKSRIIHNCRLLAESIEDLGLNPEDYLGKKSS